MKSKYDVVIIGCGTSAGFLLSFLKASGRTKPSVLIIERKAKSFRKIRASGNGRCNYSNLDFSENRYFSFTADREWKRKAFESVLDLNLKDYFYHAGIPSRTDEYGRIFPFTNSAATIAEYFEDSIRAAGAELQPNSEVTLVTHDNITGKYRVEWMNVADKSRVTAAAGTVIFAAGGSAHPQLGTDGSAFGLLKALGHKVTQQIPGIVPLETPHKEFHKLDGLKMETEILFKDFRRTGELLFTNYGISGPNVLYASNTISVNLAQGPINIAVNFLPHKSFTLDYFRGLWKNSRQRTLPDVFRGALQSRFIDGFLGFITSGAPQRGGKLTDGQLKEVYGMLTRCPMQVTRTRKFDEAQVSLGGVRADEVNPATFESLLHKNLYILGEALDYTGETGGYNIHWCAATAQRAAASFKYISH